MTFEDFGRLDDEDEASYVTLLIETSAQILRTQGHPEQATQIVAYFKETGKSGGVQQFAATLRQMNATNKLNATNPNRRIKPLQIEDAMSATLRDKGVKVSANELAVQARSFKPANLPRQHPIGTG